MIIESLVWIKGDRAAHQRESCNQIIRRATKMTGLLFWIYLLNAILLINHEIDSAYWNEWELFRLPGGISGFLLLHFPILFLVLYGLVLVYQGSTYGLWISLLLALSGIFAFTIHTYFILKGRSEFKVPLSIFILACTLVASILQAILTVIELA